MVVIQARSQPKVKCSLNRGNIQKLKCLFQDHHLRAVAQRPKLLEVGAPVSNQILIVAGPKKTDAPTVHINTPRPVHGSSRRIHKNSRLNFSKDSRRLCWRFDSWRSACWGKSTLSLQVGLQHLAPISRYAPERSHTPLCKSVLVLLRQGLFSAGFPSVRWHRILNPTLPECKKEVCLALLGFLKPTCQPQCRYRRPFIGLLSWIIYDIVLCLLFARKRQQEKIEKIMFNRRRRWHHLSRVILPLLPSQRVGFCCRHIWFWSWDLSWFCQTTSLTQLCGSWTRVSSLDLYLWWSFWTPLRCLQKCTTLLHIDQNLRFWPRDPDQIVYQHFGYVFFLLNLLLHFCKLFCCSLGWWFPVLEAWYTSFTTSHRSEAGIPSIRKPASNEIISHSLELSDTEVCFLRIQLVGTNVRLPKILGQIPAEVYFDSSRSPAKSESWNSPN